MPSATRQDQLVLVPWDPNSPEHVNRIYAQRVQCGWDKQLVEGWKERQISGQKSIFWITLRPDDPETRETLQLHLDAYPEDKAPLVDTAESLRAKPRKPTNTKFYPVGHISLDDRNEKTGNFVLDLPKEGVYWIKTFYVSKALRSKGIGRAAMDIVESMAIEEPLCAKTLALDTAEKEMQKKLYREKNGKELGSTNQDCLSDGGFHGKFGVTWFPRCRFGGRFGGVATGWPAKGGYYSHLCSVAELEFLGIDRFKPANNLLGAKWYRDPFHQLSDQDKNDDNNAPRLFVGWPADGGVWAIHTTLFDSQKRGLGRIGNAFTMSERCEVIKQLGGSFYNNPKECSFLDLDGSKDEEKQEDRSSSVSGDDIF
ncbi:hypothetical protein FAGAP_6467 [Fusarium agapanthi]|uniref:N-acetyltransferase domain-containing protein n=1 Tax=Fusarium agapanthi TaxID=1803897 RepID=A0A9P5B900_9HYPO|nr:hypothetical protein FAGAP_6467 [Fusarium agapanthi]